MGWIDAIAGKLGYAPRRRSSPGYAAADFSRLTASLLSETQFINTTLRYQLRALRARSRQAAQNNPFAKRFFQMVVDNVGGPQPFRLEGKNKFRSGLFNESANDKLEEAWCDWGRAGNCEITGKWSWNTLQRLLIRNLAIDGEVLLRKYRGSQYGRHGFQLQVIDIDRLWELKNASLANGGAIASSVEIDANGKPVAYHITKRRPSQWQSYHAGMESERVPAADVLHIFVPDFAEQVRGVPWIYAALLNLVHLGAFEEAAVIAARVGAAQMGFIQMPDGDASPLATSNDAQGNAQIDAEAGAFINLPPGATIGGWNPKYPDAAVGPFVKSTLRGIAAGLGVAYHNLANDLEGVNYSSARIGELDERDAWMGLQTFVCEHLLEAEGGVFPELLEMQTTMGLLPGMPDKYANAIFRPRRWAWVDPLKEVGAQIEAINSKLKSRTQVAADNGDDLEDVFDEIAQETAMAESMDIDLEPVQPKVGGAVNEPGVKPGDAGDAADNAAAGTSGKHIAAVPRWRDAKHMEAA